MRRANHHGVRRKLAAILKALAHLDDQRTRDNQCVESDEGDFAFPVVENDRADFAGIVDAFRERFPVTAGDLHADFRRDVPLGKCGAEFRASGTGEGHSEEETREHHAAMGGLERVKSQSRRQREACEWRIV